MRHALDINLDDRTDSHLPDQSPPFSEVHRPRDGRSPYGRSMIRSDSPDAPSRANTSNQISPVLLLLLCDVMTRPDEYRSPSKTHRPNVPLTLSNLHPGISNALMTLK